MANFALNSLFARMGAARDTNVLNDLIIGAAAAVLTYVWVSRQDAKHALELSREKLMQEAIHEERKRMALELHDTVCQAHTGAIMHLESAGDFLGDNPAPETPCSSCTAARAREHDGNALRALGFVPGGIAKADEKRHRKCWSRI